jgi:hypothetical protein
MTPILPVISMSELQRSGKEKLEAIRDYAVIQRHGKDVAFVLHPELGRLLLQTGMLEALKKQSALFTENKSDHILYPESNPAPAESGTIPELDRLIGQVLRELSKR